MQFGVAESSGSLSATLAEQEAAFAVFYVSWKMRRWVNKKLLGQSY